MVTQTQKLQKTTIFFMLRWCTSFGTEYVVYILTCFFFGTNKKFALL